jgi:hypothetical protein
LPKARALAGTTRAIRDVITSVQVLGVVRRSYRRETTCVDSDLPLPGYDYAA